MDDHSNQGLPELSFAGIPSFLKSDVVEPDEIPNGTDAAIVGVPFDGGAARRPGARFGPRGLREATGVYSYYRDYKGGLVNVETMQEVDYSKLSLVDCGDAPTVPSDIKRTREHLRKYVRRVRDRTLPIVLGGDHYLTFPAFEGVAHSLDESIGVIQFDAHSDTVRESSLHGKHYHGSPMARIAETEYGSYQTHALIGVRGHEAADYFDRVEQYGSFVSTMDDIREIGIEETVTSAVSHVTDIVDNIYVTMDIDVIDPAFAPGTGSPEPGGLTSEEFVRLVDQLGDIPEIAALDLMEVSPPQDPTEATVSLGAKAITRFLESRFV